MPFRFPLASVLGLRESFERNEERKLQQLQLEIGRILQEIEDLGKEIAESRKRRDQALKNPIPASELHLLLAHTELAAQKQEDLRGQLAKVMQQRDEQTEIYRAARRDREMLSDMASRQREAYNREQVRKEQKALDDIFSARSRR